MLKSFPRNFAEQKTKDCSTNQTNLFRHRSVQRTMIREQTTKEDEDTVNQPTASHRANRSHVRAFDR